MIRNDQAFSNGEEEFFALNEQQNSEEPSAINQQISSNLFTARTSTNIPPPEERTEETEIQAQIISPSMSGKNTCFMVLPKGQLVILLQGAGVEKLEEETISLKYYSKSTNDGQREEMSVITKLIKPLLEEQGAGVYKLVLPLDFAQHLPGLQAGDFLKLNFLEQLNAQLFYRPNDKLKVDNAEELASSKAHLEKRLRHLWLEAADARTLQEYLPELVLTEHGSGKSYVSMPLLQEQIQDRTTLEAVDVESSSKEAIQTQQAALTKKQELLQTIAYKFDLAAFPYEQLAINYEGEDKAIILDKAYEQQVQVHQGFKQLLGQQLLRIQEQQQSLQVVLQEKSIPASLKEATAVLENQKEAISRRFELLEGDLHAIQVLPLNFADWSKNIKTLEQVPQEAKATYVKEKAVFNQVLQDYEQSHPESQQAAAYMEWKTALVKAHQTFERGMIKNLKRFKEFVQEKKVPLAATGGDGKLEYHTNENQVSKAEQARFGDPIPAKVVFNSTEVPLYDNGISPEDVIQGGVGDCYLMAALMLLAEEDTKHLIHEMIVEEGDKYVVQLYSNDMPVAVEVDKETLFLEYEDGYQTDVGAKTKKELWVAIIEKAYAKYQGSIPSLKEQLEMGKAGGYDKKLPLEPSDYGGDYTKIEGSQTSLAIEALVGNRLSEEQYIYLDEAGNVSEEETARVFPVRVNLQQGDIGEEDLKDLLLASYKAGYKIGVDSPEGMDDVEGLTHDHLMEISPDVYMKFQHAYVLGGVNQLGVKLLDPHGKIEKADKNFYTHELVKNISELNKQLDLLTRELKESNYSSFSSETKNNFWLN
ncbi:MAG: C2 family cysteine protease [Aureispira sp.]